MARLPPLLLGSRLLPVTSVSSSRSAILEKFQLDTLLYVAYFLIPEDRTGELTIFRLMSTPTASKLPTT